MQSLRTHRPSGSKSNRQSTKPSKPDARKSRVDDKIKKRMSMRYAEISGPTGISEVPEVPTLPSTLRPGRGNSGDDANARVLGDGASVATRRERSDDPRVLERRMLDKDDFDPDACRSYPELEDMCASNINVIDLRVKLANSTESELRTLQSSLRASKDDVASDLQRNVFKKCVVSFSVSGFLN